MTTLNVRNVNEALPLGLALVQRDGVPVVSRGLKTLEVPGPVMTVYTRPWENVLMCPVRDANPFFHLFEFAWILAGDNCVHTPAFFLQKYKEYSDDGATLHGAYGHRMRSWKMGNGMVVDQLEKVVSLLAHKPDTRQAVVSIWNPMLDLGATTKDMPCNDMVMFNIRADRLNMTVNNRSNDVIWGAYGANAVQFSFLQMWVAARLGVGMGVYAQVSNSYHVYEDLPLWQKYVTGEYRPDGHVVNPYDAMEYYPVLLDAADAIDFEQDCIGLVQMANQGTLPRMAMVPSVGWKSHAGRELLRPALLAFLNYKAGDFRAALSAAQYIGNNDWRKACCAWLLRREEARKCV